MPKITIRPLGGMAPKLDARSLPPHHSQVAVNAKLWPAALWPTRAPLLVFTPTKTGVIQSMYRMYSGATDYWLHWAADVDAHLGPLADDEAKRLYYTGEYEPRVTNLEMASAKTDTVNGANNYPGGYGESGSTDYPRAFYALGVQEPFCPPVLGAPSGGSGTDEQRAYVYTYVTAWGEESKPSPPSTEQNGKPNGSWPLSLMDVAPLNTGSILGATHASGVATVYTSGTNSLMKGHRFTIASVSGAVELNTSWTAHDALNLATTTTSRTRTGTHATLTVRDARYFAVGQIVTVASVGGSGYNGTRTLTAVDTAANTITFADATGSEGATADTGGKITMGLVKVAVAAMTAYTSGGTWTRQAPYNVASMKKRIYRTLTGVTGAIWEFVDEIAAATTTYTDTKIAEQLGEELVSTDWERPPGDMIGLVRMPNGMMAGFTGKDVYFCEPYTPYAWPSKYSLTMHHDIVGLGARGAVLLVCKTALATRIYGNHPEALAQEDLEEAHPCLAKRGIVSSGVGVLYPSDHGLVMDSASGSVLLTEKLYDREKWNSDVRPESFIAFNYDNRYHAFWPQASAERLTFSGIMLDFDESAGALSVANAIVNGAWRDPETGSAYIVHGGGIFKWDASYDLTYQWESRKFVLQRPTTFRAAKVEGEYGTTEAQRNAVDDYNAIVQAANAALIAAIPVGAAKVSPLRGGAGGAAVGALGVGEDVIGAALGYQKIVKFQIYADDVLKYSKNLTSSAPFRIHGGYTSKDYKFAILGDAQVFEVVIAETMSELTYQ